MNIKYTALFIDNREKILNFFDPKHSNIFCDHVTLRYKPDNLDSIDLGKKSTLRIIGRAFDEKGDALLVDTDRSNNKYPHITLSCVDGVRPVYSNELFQKEKIEYFDNPFVADVIEGYFDGDNMIIT